MLRGAIPLPPVELSAPRQVTGPVGSLVLVHYLLGHNIGGHFGSACDERRETVYFRLRAVGHRRRWREAVTDPLLEFTTPAPEPRPCHGRRAMIASVRASEHRHAPR